MGKTTHVFIWGKVCASYRSPSSLCIYGNNRKTPPARILRWAIRLQGYDFKVEYIKGNCNSADVLSRTPCRDTPVETDEAEQTLKQVIAHAVPRAVSLQEMILEYNKDKCFHSVGRYIQTDNWEKRGELRHYWEVRSELSYKNGLLLREDKLIIPVALRDCILKIAHEAHLRITKTKQLLRT